MSKPRSITTTFPVGLFCQATISGPLPKVADWTQEQVESDPATSHLRLLKRDEAEEASRPHIRTWED